ncbi:hypothetical protein X801_04472 [Opisthorchis viverrini]|uniref:Uncharacterized protein n=1 Tax=Opisthorchis viverrini TaxID=6198 RepID=A0A1S8WYY5_OPIVI|nr:hypothetical protein X801_04472 [Opisthorchis viverrini]
MQQSSDLSAAEIPVDVLLSYCLSSERLQFKSPSAKRGGKGNALKNTLQLEKLKEAEQTILQYVQLKNSPHT